jgi:hypothetical protein
MFFKTKLSRNINKIFYTLKERVLIVQNSFSLALFALFLGFLCGNLFGTFLDTLRIYFIWNGFVAFIILLFVETINFFIYRIPLAEKINANLSVSNVQNSNPLLTQRQTFLRSAMNVASLIIPLVRRKGRDVRLAKVSKTIYIKRSINAFKIGLLFGFFIDSFKVGS